MKINSFTTSFLLLIIFNASLFSQDSLELYLPLNGRYLDESHNAYEIGRYYMDFEKDKNGVDNSCVSAGLYDSSRIEINEVIIDLNEDFTISAWFNKNDVSTYVKYLLTSRYNVYGDEGGGADLRIINDTILKFTLRSLSPLEDVYNIQYDYLQSNKWYMVVIVKESDEMTLYLNNVFIGKVNSINQNTVTNNANWSVGAARNLVGWYRPFQGLIDDIRIYNKSLSVESIDNLFKQESNIYDTLIITDTNEINIYDTISVFDTLIWLDTTKIVVSDTLIISDTNEINIYDTISVFDTLIWLDTTKVVIYDTLNISVSDTLVIPFNLSGNQAADTPDYIKIYPNPAKTNIVFNFGDAYNESLNYRIKISNIQGQIIYENYVRDTFVILDINTLDTSGINFVQIIDDSNNIIVTKKIFFE